MRKLLLLLLVTGCYNPCSNTLAIGGTPPTGYEAVIQAVTEQCGNVTGYIGFVENEPMGCGTLDPWGVSGCNYGNDSCPNNVSLGVEWNTVQRISPTGQTINPNPIASQTALAYELCHSVCGIESVDAEPYIDETNTCAKAINARACQLNPIDCQ